VTYLDDSSVQTRFAYEARLRDVFEKLPDKEGTLDDVLAALEKRFGKFMNYTRTAQGTLQWEEDAAQVLMNSGSFMRASYPERPSQVVFTLRPGSSGK